jgi:hypothetical protein
VVLLEGAIAVAIVGAVALATGVLDSGSRSAPERPQVALAAWSRSATPLVTALVQDEGGVIRQLSGSSHADIKSSVVDTLRSDLGRARTMKPPPGPAGAPAPAAWTIAITQLADAVTVLDAGRSDPAGAAAQAAQAARAHLTASAQAILGLSQAIQLGQVSKPG